MIRGTILVKVTYRVTWGGSFYSVISHSRLKKRVDNEEQRILKGEKSDF